MAMVAFSPATGPHSTHVAPRAANPTREDVAQVTRSVSVWSSSIGANWRPHWDECARRESRDVGASYPRLQADVAFAQQQQALHDDLFLNNGFPATVICI